MEKQLDMLSDAGTIGNNVSTSENLTDNTQAKLDTLSKKAVHLRFVLEKDFKACDIKWSLFVAAAFSFRYESCLRPFPPAFLKHGVKDMDELLRVISDVPALDLVLEQMITLQDLSKVSDIIHLLFYVLVRLKEPLLKTILPESFEQVLSSVESVEPAPRPQYIFQVLSASKSNAEQKWKDLAKNHNIFHAYHGSHLENFYSMLSFSVQQHLNKGCTLYSRQHISELWSQISEQRLYGHGVKVHDAIFVTTSTTQSTMVGNGLYLTSELSASLPYSRGGFGWGASCIGGHISCIALCEVIDAPEGINYQKPSANEGRSIVEALLLGDTNLYNLQYLSGYSGDTAGAGYERRAAHYIVTNSDLIRVRYILVYAKQPALMRFPTATNNRNEGGLCQWLSKHKLVSILLGYGLMLATIGCANNQPMQHYYESFLNMFDFKS